MKTLRSSTLTMLLLALLPSCQDRAAKLGEGFRLPEGSIEQGKTAFVALKCHQCHSVAGVKLPDPIEPATPMMELGGEVRMVKSYGELVTAIIQPQHIIAPEYLAKLEEAKRDGAVSPMPSFNGQMTVTQLTDIVTFLHTHYQKAPPPGANYPRYMP